MSISKTDKDIARAVDKIGQASENEIHLSTGVVLRAKQANPNVLIRIMTAVPRPKPPTYYDEMMGKMMENPDHPDYRKQVEAWEMQYNNGMLNALIGLGTELVSKPKGIPSPSDDSWISDYQALGLPVVKDSKAWRYITWVLYVAAPTDKDTRLIAEKVRALSGVREEDVQAAESFPNGHDPEGTGL